jgi:glycerol transport system ATP-binding protein
MAEIVLDGVTKVFDDGYEAVKDLNLDIADGEFMILVGPSGCGKSTALRMIAGLEDISSGELKIDDEVMNDRSPKDRDIAMVFQNYALYPHMTVRENMGFALSLAKVDKAEIDSKVEDAARTLDLTEHLDRKPVNLSGGQRQRVAMGRAIVRDPKVFLMDEPLSNLDAKLRVQMRTEVARLQSDLGTTMIYVTHDQTEALTFADTVVVMHDGRVVQSGTPAELFDKPAHTFVGYFIGSPGMNIVSAEVRGREARIDGHVVALDRNYDRLPSGAKIEIGVRPEFVDVALPAPGLLSANIERIDDLGRVRFARVRIGETKFAARVPPGFSVQGEIAGLKFDPSHVHVYADSLLVEGAA